MGPDNHFYLIVTVFVLAWPDVISSAPTAQDSVEFHETNIPIDIICPDGSSCVSACDAGNITFEAPPLGTPVYNPFLDFQFTNTLTSLHYSNKPYLCGITEGTHGFVCCLKRNRKFSSKNNTLYGFRQAQDSLLGVNGLEAIPRTDFNNFNARYRAHPKCGESFNDLLEETDISSSDPGLTDYGEFPWQVALFWRQSNVVAVFGCSGTLIHPRVVITAGHCVTRGEMHNLVIRLGDWDLEKTNEPLPVYELPVSNVFLHPDFNPRTHSPDLALLELSEEVDLNVAPHINPVCLPINDVMWEHNRAPCLSIGWEATTYVAGHEKRLPGFLWEVDVTLGTQLCPRTMRQTRYEPCIKQENSHVCVIDEGGPILCEVATEWQQSKNGIYLLPDSTFFLVAVVSEAPQCTENVPGRAVSINPYIHWIVDILAHYKPYQNIKVAPLL